MCVWHTFQVMGLLSLKNLIFLKSYFFILKTEFQKEGDRERWSNHWFTTQMAIKVWTQEPHWGLPCGYGVKDLGHPLMFAQAINQELDWKWSKWDSNWRQHEMPVLQVAVLTHLAHSAGFLKILNILWSRHPLLPFIQWTFISCL